MRRTTTLLTTALFLAGLTAGCSSNSDDKATVTKESSSASASRTASASTSPTPKALEIGDTAQVKSSDGDFSAAVLSFKDEGIRSDPGLLTNGGKWAVVEAKVCNKNAEGFVVSPFTWTLAYEDGARLEPTHVSGGGLPQPLYPMDAKVRTGDCVRGNITFEVPDEGRPERVLYSPDVVDEPVEWQIDKG